MGVGLQTSGGLIMRRLPDIWPYVLALALLVAFAAGVACIAANLDG